MDRRELANEPDAGLLAALTALKADIWTALPGFIKSYDPLKRTCTIQPAVQVRVLGPTGIRDWVSLPLLLDCPVVFPQGGGCLLTFPLAIDDEVLVIFADRCIDAWWQSGKESVQADLRFHDLSDGFCLPGVSSVPKVTSAISTTTVELRTADHAAVISINPTTHAVAVTTTGSVTATAGTDATITASGNLNLTASNINITGVLSINGAPYLGHHHSGVSIGAATTGGVV